MSYTIRGRVDGLQEMIQSLAGLKEAVIRRILRAAVSKGSQIIMKKAKQLASRETGLLRKSIGRKVKVYRTSGVAVAMVGPRIGFRTTVTRKKGKLRPTPTISDPVKYAHLVERGTKPHGRHPGFQARPFLEPAARGQTGAIRQAMAEEIRRQLEKEAAKALKKKGGA